MIYHIKVHEWEAIFKYLKEMKGLQTGCEEELRIFIESIWFIAPSGCQWRLLPREYGKWRSIHRRFKRWCVKGVWEELMNAVMDKDMEHVMIDSTIIRAHACAAGYGKNSQDKEALGRSAGGFTSKVHALVDALGNPLKFLLTPGQKHDITQAQSLTRTLKNTKVIADRGYISQEFSEKLKSQACTSVIPSRKNQKTLCLYDPYIYKERHLVECFFSKIKHFRRIFSRFDKSAISFLGFLYFVGSFIWLR